MHGGALGGWDAMYCCSPPGPVAVHNTENTFLYVPESVRIEDAVQKGRPLHGFSLLSLCKCNTMIMFILNYDLSPILTVTKQSGFILWFTARPSTSSVDCLVTVAPVLVSIAV